MRSHLILLMLPCLLLGLFAAAPVAAAQDDTAATENATGDDAGAADDGAATGGGAGATEGGGEDTAAAEPEESQFWKQIKAGGWPMVVLAFLSIAGLGIILERLVNLNRGTIAPSGFAEEMRKLWNKGDKQAVAQACSEDGSILAKVLGHAAENPDKSLAEINEETGEIASRELRQQLQSNYWLATVATLSPLMGLLGTILGMIKAFDVVAVAGDIGDISLVAEGISQALVTTATGLTIAVPALAFFHVFKVRTNKLSITLEEESSDTLKKWFGEG